LIDMEFGMSTDHLNRAIGLPAVNYQGIVTICVSMKMAYPSRRPQ
jgi:hypothetical protein